MRCEEKLFVQRRSKKPTKYVLRPRMLSASSSLRSATIAKTLLPLAFLSSGRGCSEVLPLHQDADVDAGLDAGLDANADADFDVEVDEKDGGGGIVRLPPVSVGELPLEAFTRAELDTSRLAATLPLEFELVPTPPPAQHSNLCKVTKDNLLRNANWQSNLYRLVMGRRYRPLIGRYVRVAGQDATRYLELPFCAYSIKFHRDALDLPDVVFVPLFVARGADANAWARSATDTAAPGNHVPFAPPGAVLPFERLPRAQSVDFTRKRQRGSANGAELGAQHPVVAGARLFPHMGPAPRAASYQDGGVGIMLYRLPPDVSIHPEMGMWAAGQTVVLYVRLAFSRAALDPVAAQLEAIHNAVGFALGNTIAFSAADGTCVPYVQRHPYFPSVHFECAAADFESRVTTLNAISVQQLAELDVAQTLLDAGDAATPEQALNRARAMFRVADTGSAHVFVAAAETDAMQAAETFVQLRHGDHDDGDDDASGVAHAEHYSDGERALVVERCRQARARCAKRVNRFAASMLLYDIAPPDAAAFGAAPVVVVGVPLAVRTFCTAADAADGQYAERRRTSLNDLVTRFAFDIMLALPAAMVQPPRDESMLAVFTEKAPGILDVEQATTGLPKRHTASSATRRQVNPHPALPLGFRVDDVDGAGTGTKPKHKPMHKHKPKPKLKHKLKLKPATHSENKVENEDEDADQDEDQDEDQDNAEVKDKDGDENKNGDDETEAADQKGAELDAALGAITALPVVTPPPLTRAEADANLLLRHTLAGPLLPSAVPGTQVSVYAPNSKCHASSFSGTSHSWVNVGAFIAQRLTVPFSVTENPHGLFEEEESAAAEAFAAKARAAVNLLWAPFYNVTHNQVWRKRGTWSTPEAGRRTWRKAYGVTVGVLHAAMFWQLYPAFVSELRNPVTLDIWRLKQACEAELQWMSRTGRIIRMLLNQSRRKLRYDFPLVLRNYYMRVRRPTLDDDAPILPLCLSAINTFGGHLVFGRRLQASAQPNVVFRRSIALPTSAETAAAAFGAFQSSGANPAHIKDEDEDEDDDAIAAAAADQFGCQFARDFGVDADEPDVGACESEMTRYKKRQRCV